jgi:radical SAM superfamily enzyme YgiQ (UPF0313 family)
MQSSVPELIAALCPEDAEIELYNEKEGDIPLDRHWDLVFFSYLHSFYEHTKVLSSLFRRRGMTTVAGGRHASQFPDDCLRYFDCVVAGEPEANVPRLISDFQRGALERVYDRPSTGPASIRPYRYDLIDYKTNAIRLPGIEASRGCPFTCNFCVLTGKEQYRLRPVQDVVAEIEHKMTWNPNLFGLFDGSFVFLDNNLGGNPRYLKELCEALVPLRKIWGCALTFNILENPELVRLMAKAGCRYIYTGLESLNPASIQSMNKRQNRLGELRRVLRHAYSSGIILSFGMIVGSDGDTSEYLEKVPEYLADIDCQSITYLGIVCPYPGTPFHQQLAREGRLLPGTISRDYDGYTLCHRPSHLDVSEVVEHYKRLGRTLSSFSSIAHHYWSKLWLSDQPRYRRSILVSAREIFSVRNPCDNRERTFIGGKDPLEAWDARMMGELGLEPQWLS